MTPPDQPEEAPSALSRLERALAGFGEPKTPPAPEPEPEVVDEEPEPEPEPEPEAEPEEEQWVPASSSVLDIAAAVAAVEQLTTPSPATESTSSAAPPQHADPDSLLVAPPSDADALVLAATAAGTPARDRVAPVARDEGDEDEDEIPRFEPADLRARIQDFATEDEEYDEPADEPEAEEPEARDDAEQEEPPVAADHEDAMAEADERTPERVADASASWQPNLGDTTLPYFLVEENEPVAAPAPEPVTTVEELRERLVRPVKTKEADAKPPASIARTLAEIPVLLIVAAVIAFLVKTFLAQAYYIPSGSMLPQLQINDRVVVSKLTYKVHDPRRGDIIVFDDPRTGAAATKTDEGLFRKVGEGIGIVQPSTDEFIKRVIGLPGETVEGKNGHVYINGHRLIEPYLKPSVITSDFAPVKVQPGRLWVMGDNRTGSADSRVFGQIKINTIVGRALVKVWPFDHASFL